MYLPTSSKDLKSVRLSCRINPGVKEQAEEAARLLGQSITDFTETALAEKARNVIAENERILVSEHAFEEFVAAISQEPKQPSEKLLSAIDEYHKHSPIVRRS